MVTLTSNPEGSQVQQARGPHGSVAGEILDRIRTENAGTEPTGSIGAVVGANLASLDEDVVINGPLLAPGFGAQGGGVDDIRRLFSKVLPDVLPSTSRDVLRAGPHVATLRDVARRTIENVQAAVV